jgi:hypothetical protein
MLHTRGEDDSHSDSIILTQALSALAFDICRTTSKILPLIPPKIYMNSCEVTLFSASMAASFTTPIQHFIAMALIQLIARMVWFARYRASPAARRQAYEQRLRIHRTDF